MLPTIVTLAATAIAPLGYIIYQSFFSFNLSMPWATNFVGFENYIHALKSPAFWTSVKVSFSYLLRALPIQLLFGLGIALLLNKNFWGNSVARLVLATPLVLAPSVTAVIWRLMFNPQTSLINHILSLAGIAAPTWLGDRSVALWSLVIVDTWQWTPFAWLIMLAGLAALPQEIYEAAQVDGASPLQAFWHITLPLLSSKIVLIALFRGLLILKDFDKVFVLTGGGPADATETLSLHTYYNAFWWFDIGYSSALSVLYLIMVIIATTILYKKVRL